MKSRPSLILELKDNFNNTGYGEVWCNFPSNAAEYRFNIFKNIFVNKLKNIEIDDLRRGWILKILDSPPRKRRFSFMVRAALTTKRARATSATSKHAASYPPTGWKKYSNVWYENGAGP